jgi:hypothetical protein
MLVTPTRDGTRPGYYGSDAGFGTEKERDAEISFGGGEGISDEGARRALANNASLRAGVDNAAAYRADAENRKKAKEKADKERRASERKEARKDQKN